jgi:hypothetical protein
MKKNTLINIVGYVMVLLSFMTFILALHMETGFQFWIIALISIGYLVCSGFVFNCKTEDQLEGF